MKFYAGIGSRQTPPAILEWMTEYADILDQEGYHLRSGGADGADAAFEAGCHGYAPQIWRPEHATPNAIDLASRFHPAWHRCSDYARKLHGRNVHIILGRHLLTPVDFVLCWTPGGKTVGGTAMGIRVAEGHSIPVYNLYNVEQFVDLFEYILE